MLRRRLIVLCTIAVCLTAALLYSVLATPLFSATSQLLIDPRDRQVVSKDLNASVLAADGGITVVESQVKVIESNAVLLRAVAAAGLEDDPEFSTPHRGLFGRLWRELSGVPSAPRGAEDRRRRALANLRRRLLVKRADKVFVVDIVATATGPDKAARIANAVAEAYLTDQASARAEAARRASGELGARLGDLLADVNKAEAQLESYKEKNGLIASSGRLVSEQQLTDSNARLVAARDRTAEAKSRLQDLRTARGTAGGAVQDLGALPEAMRSATIQRLRGQYAEIAGKESDLSTQLGPRHPSLMAVRAQRADIKRLIDVELDRIVKAAEIDYARARGAERLLDENLGRLKVETAQTSKATARLRELEGTVAASRSVYDSYLVRTREIAEQAGVDPTNARVITSAQPPLERNWPLPGVIISAGLALGLGFGVGGAMLREYARPTLLSRAQLEQLLGVPVLAVFTPALDTDDAVCFREAAIALDAIHVDVEGEGHAVVAAIASAACDADERGAAAELLAATAAARGDRVLLLDAGAGGAAGGGLAEALRGAASIRATARSDAATGVQRIGFGDAIGPGNATGSKPSRAAFASFLDQACRQFDLVLIDAGALPSNPPIGSLVAGADQFLVVARPGRVPQSDLLDLDRVANAMGHPLTGALLVDDRACPR